MAEVRKASRGMTSESRAAGRNMPQAKPAGSRKKKKRKKKSSGVLGPLIGLLFGSGIVALMLLAVFLVLEAGKPEKGITNGGAGDSGAGHYSVDKEYIRIDADSFMAYVGQTYTLSVSANPVELVESVVWSSSNEEAVVVDDRGMVVIVGEGVAAVTATSGKYSSAIAIEAVKDASAKGTMGFDMLGTPDNILENIIGDNTQESRPEGGVEPSEDDKAAAGDGVTDQALEEMSGEEYTSAGNSTEGVQGTEAGQDTQGGSSQNGAGSGEPQGGNPQGDGSTSQEVSEEATTEYMVPTTQAAGAIDTEEMFSVLSSAGFSQYLPNASIYESDGEYFGEIIVESDSVHIYIKKRSASFDMGVRSALAYLLPDTSESVWSVYASLSSDKTINSDGRRVRFVMPAVNAHSQIIVYNP